MRPSADAYEERIANLSDVDLNLLMADLLRAHAYRCIGTAAGVRTNAEIKAGDDGCDGWTPAPKTTDPWFGDQATCWQFKAGTAGEPRKLRNEITKAIPRETLTSGGRFVVIASGSTSGIRGERARVKALREEAIAAGIPDERIEVLGADRLTRWCNEHPAVAARWAGRSDGLQQFGTWSAMDAHQAPWQSSGAIRTS